MSAFTSISEADLTPAPDSSAKVVPGGSGRRGNAGVLLLLLLVAAFSVFYFALSLLRYTEFYATNWDLGIGMQSLWTLTQGYPANAAGNYEFVGAGSFFFIHTTYILIPVAGLYGLVPSASTLFALQAVVVASSAIPLYLIGRAARVPVWLLLVALTVYLGSFPIVSAVLFDFHWEAFILAEFLWTYYLWDRGRYWAALIPVTAGLLTLEVFPVLMVGLVVYFAYPFLVSLRRTPRAALHDLIAHPRRAAPLLGLLVLVALAHFLLSYLTAEGLPLLTGESPTFPAAGPYLFLGVYWWGVSATTIGDRLLYWLLLLASLGFLPLLYRRPLLILSLPWFLYSVFMVPISAYTEFGFQYAFIAVGPLAISFVEAVGAIHRAWPSPAQSSELSSEKWLVLLLPFFVGSLLGSLYLLEGYTDALWIGAIIAAFTAGSYLALTFVPRSRESHPSPPPVGPPRRWRRPARSRSVLVGALILLAASNIALSPLNPSNFRGPGLAGYSFQYNSNPMYSYVPALAAKVPSDASIVASDNLFPFVANNPNAYSLLWYPGFPPYLPFNATHLPAYVLVSSSEWFAVPPYLTSTLFDAGVYGAVTLLYSNIDYPGPIYLFERGYSGPVNVVQVTPFPGRTLLCGHDFGLGPSGVVLPAAGSVCGVIVQSQPASNLSGNNVTIWYGPYLNLIPGNYSVTVSLKGEFPVPSSVPRPVVVMDGSAENTGYWYSLYITQFQLSMSSWTNFTYHFTLTQPCLGAEFRGDLALTNINGTYRSGFVEMNDVVLVYSP